MVAVCAAALVNRPISYRSNNNNAKTFAVHVRKIALICFSTLWPAQCKLIYKSGASRNMIYEYYKYVHFVNKSFSTRCPPFARIETRASAGCYCYYQYARSNRQFCTLVIISNVHTWRARMFARIDHANRARRSKHSIIFGIGFVNYISQVQTDRTHLKHKQAHARTVVRTERARTRA